MFKSKITDGAVFSVRCDRNDIVVTARLLGTGNAAPAPSSAQYPPGGTIHAAIHAPYNLPLRIDSFGLSNYAGLGATLILLLLLTLSNNATLRALGASRWKSLQRWNYAGALLVVAHGAVYQIIEKRAAGFVVAFAAIVLFGLAMQFAGFSMVRKQKKIGVTVA
jgi:DMSO/TMAO reductase YedYZ heme-binding membrane subunit